MIPNDIVKAAVVDKLKGISALIARLPDGLQGVREYGWRGNIFQYPCVRVELETQLDLTPDSECTPVNQSWSAYIFSDMHSSQEADEIAGIIAVYFKGLSFSGTGIKFTSTEVLENIPAIPEDERTWRSQVRCRSIVYEAQN